MTTPMAASCATGLIRPSAVAGRRAERQGRHSAHAGRRRGPATRSASWVTTATAQPRARCSASRVTSSRQVAASWPNVGSSSTSTRGRGGERGGDRQPALLAAGQRVRVGVGERGEAQPLEELLGGGPGVRGVLAGAQRAQGELVAQPAGEELLLGVLEDRADPADQLPGPPPVRFRVPVGARRRSARPRP